MADEAIPEIFAGFTPLAVWKYFAEISAIPRCSGHEERIRDHIERFAKGRQIECERDEAGNVLLRVRPNAPGKSVCLQGHMDMVCVKDDAVVHDFEKDPISFRRDGDFIYANGTTLGADNGIGLAFALALIDDTTGPLEILCTVDEEVGLTGASKMRPKWLRSKFLLNLDSEEESSLTVACSGGRDLVVTAPWALESAPADLPVWSLRIKGLLGGHSGIDIHRNKTNALQVLGRVLAALDKRGGRLFEVEGGVKRNAIAPSASALLGLAADQIEDFAIEVEAIRRSMLSKADPDLTIELLPDGSKPALVATPPSLSTLVGLLNGLPHGVQKTVTGNPEQPFVSINLAMVLPGAKNELVLIMSGRSPVAAEIDALEATVRSIAASLGASLKTENDHPGWAPNYSSPLLAATKRCYIENFGREAQTLEIHAGLECGIIGSKHAGLDMISIGPDIFAPHSPKEHVSISSVERMYGLCKRLIADLQNS